MSEDIDDTPTEGDKKIDNLEERLKAARQEFNEDYNPPPAPNTHSEGANIGYEFLAYVISGGVIGYSFDHFVGTMPFGMMIFMIFGFVGGVYRANARTKQINQKKK